MRDHEGLVRKIVSRYCGNGDDTRDLVATIWTKTYASAGNVRTQEDFPRWLAAIARNCCIDYLRGKRYAVPIDLIAEETAAPEETVLDQLASRQSTDLLHQALQSLSEEDRLIIVLHHIKGESVKAISGKLDISVSSAKVKLYRARERLRDLLVQSGII